ncbi:ABC transporter substrate-binding protein [Microlunatus soli]|uniref:Tat (Twin-arginine translocation) pathway signal sequence n=1 Tax=Microlunatus soli TaxID=630515 RepID=A0A1H1Z2H3_9ACTN|nr:extracellular solute-binding protein [Microlunatus soli]SDT27386.1 Tat (twin-arginine translocation) pathway signal sequence [Microlunatus soli]
MTSPTSVPAFSRRSFLAGSAAGAGLLGLSLTGCSPKSGGTTSSDLTFWKPPVGELKWDTAFYKKLLKKSVGDKGKSELLVIPWENAETKYTAAFASKKPPDVTYQIVPWMNKFRGTNALLDLRELLPDVIKNVNGVAPETVRSVAAGPKGEVYGIPFGVGHFVLALNEDVWDAAGQPDLPTTYEEMIPFAKALTIDKSGKKLGESGFDAKNVASYGYQVTKDSNYLWNYLWNYGADLLNKDNTDIGFDNAEGRAGLSVLKKIVDSGAVVPLTKYSDDSKWAELIFKGNVAMAWIPSVSDDFAKRYPKARLKVLDIPKGPAGQFTVGGAGFWSIATKSDNTDGAAKLITDLTSEANSKAALTAIMTYPVKDQGPEFFDGITNKLQRDVMIAGMQQTKYARLDKMAPFNPGDVLLAKIMDYLIGRADLDKMIKDSSDQVKTMAAAAK